MGSASGYLSVLVLALYINSREVTELYTHLGLLWAACPPLLYWMTRIWFLAYSECINDNPIVFTVKDGTSYPIVPIIVLIMISLMSTTQQNMTSSLKNLLKITVEEWSLILTGAVFFWLFFLYLTSLLHFNVLSSDPKAYWELSLSWTIFNIWWVPAYPLLLAVVRALTFNVLPPEFLMVSVSCIFFLISIRTTYRIAQHLKLPAYEIALLFTVYPIVGLVYAAWPFADSMATAVLLLSLLAFLEKRWVLFTGYAAVGMVTHKALWYFLPLLALAALWTDRESRRSVPFMVAPVLLLLVIGSFQQGDALWMFRWSVNNLIKSSSSLPILDGVLGPFMLGATPKVLKGAGAAVILLFAIVVFVSSLRRQFWAGMCVSASIILLTCSVNQTETTSVIRYSKVLLIFVAYVVMTNGPQWLRRKGNWKRVALAAVVIASILSNMGFGYYAAKIYAPKYLPLAYGPPRSCGVLGISLGEEVLAGARGGNGRGVCPALQMAQELPDVLWRVLPRRQGMRVNTPGEACLLADAAGVPGGALPRCQHKNTFAVYFAAEVGEATTYRHRVTLAAPSV